MRQVHLFISGRVHGVWFRDNTQKKARQLGVKGWVRNTSDGKVEAVGQGDAEQLKEFISFCHDGPSAARVDDVKFEWEEIKENYNGFEVRY
ncbi:MAG: acylphosphatase [Nanoarchaeota archaeon]